MTRIPIQCFSTLCWKNWQMENILDVFSGRVEEGVVGRLVPWTTTAEAAALAMPLFLTLEDKGGEQVYPNEDPSEVEAWVEMRRYVQD